MLFNPLCTHFDSLKNKNLKQIDDTAQLEPNQHLKYLIKSITMF